jgi:hypothetical protein
MDRLFTRREMERALGDCKRALGVAAGTVDEKTSLLLEAPSR